jgi:hypothetical protein
MARSNPTVESEEVELSPCLGPLAQTARAVFPQAAFLYGRRRDVRSIVMPGTRLFKRMSPISATSRRVGHYDPAVLLKPFGPHLAMGALPSRDSSMVAPGQPICIPAFAIAPQ